MDWMFAIASSLSKKSSLLVLFLVLGFAGTPAFSARDLISKKIVAIELPKLDAKHATQIRSALGLKIGARLSRKKINRGIHSLQESGIVDSLFVFLDSAKGGVKVRVDASLIRKLRELKFDGVDDEVIDEIKLRLDLAEGKSIGAQTTSLIREFLRVSFRETGYYAAKVKVEQLNVPQSLMADISVQVQRGEPTRIDRIYIRGSRRAEAQRIRKELKLSEGDAFSRKLLEESIVEINKYLTDNQYLTSKVEKADTNFKSLGQEVDITIDINFGNRYRFDIQGNTVFDNFAIREIMTDEILVQLDAPRRISDLIKQKYKKVGYHFCEVTTRINQVKREDMTVVVFEIEEGPKVYIDKILYLGSSPIAADELNDTFYDNAPGVINRGLYYEDGLDEALANFKAALELKGYLSARTLLARNQFSKDKRGVELVIDLELGLQTRIDKIAYSQTSNFSFEEIEELLDFEVGDPVNSEKVLAARKALLKKYRENGFLEARYYRSDDDAIEISGDQLSAIIHLNVLPGVQYYVGRLSVEGNDKTREKVILRELLLRTGDIYNPVLVAESQENLLLLGLFSKVDLVSTTDPERSNIKNIKVLVRESPPGIGEIGLGGVYEDPRFRIRTFGGVAYKNLFGLNQTVALRGQVLLPISSDNFVDFVEYSANLSYSTPWPLDLPITFEGNLGLDSFEVRRDELGPEIQTGARIEFKIEKRFSDSFTGIYRLYHYERVTTEILDRPDTIQTDNIGSTGPGIIVDFRDDIYNPTKGSFHTLDLEFGHPALLSKQDIAFLLVRSKNSFYFSLPDPFSIKLYFGAGYARSLFRDQSLPKARLSSALSLGGGQSIRGFKPGEFSPGDDSVDTMYWNARGELHTALFFDLVGVLFVDSGQIFPNMTADERHTGVGFGLRYKTPVGPIAIDFAKGLGSGQGIVFYFTVGSI